MKIRISLLCTALALVFVSAFVMYQHEVLGHYLKSRGGPVLSLEDFSKMEKKRDRASALAKESPTNRSVLWRQHIKYYGSNLDLGSSQKEFLAKLTEFLSEDFLFLWTHKRTFLRRNS